MTEQWKFFLVEITYLVPAEQLGDTVAEHRAFLSTGYDKGWLLLSGPQVPRTGGLLVGRAPSREALDDFLSNDPYRVKGMASYRVVEFEPVKRQPFLEAWIEGA